MFSWQSLGVIALGGAIGAIARHVVVLALAGATRAGLPWGVLVANVSGCLVAGLVFVLLSERPGVDPLWRLLVAVGFLGAFTTFSAFSVDTLLLMQSGQLARAAVNVLANLVLCLGACGLGMWLARQL